MTTTKIICKSMGDLQTEAIHSLSGNVIYTDAPKDHDGSGRNFAPTDLLASALGTCLITIMDIEAKRRGWLLGVINLYVYKKMTTNGPRKIKSLILDIFMPYELDSYKLKILQSTAKECPVKLNLEDSIDIKLNWHQEKS
tara:strand:- start:2130 stop:2549 length:420 start_codon:yes stop_codon:yes gene_type:complete